MQNPSPMTYLETSLSSPSRRVGRALLVAVTAGVLGCTAGMGSGDDGADANSGSGGDAGGPAQADAAAGADGAPVGGDATVPTGTGYYTVGNQIHAPDGSLAVFRGVAWFGFETPNFVLHGLWQRNLEEMLDQMAGLGYDLLRVPLSNEMLHAAAPNSVNYQANPELEGLSPIQILDRLIADCGARGIHVLLDRHRPTGAAQSELWYTAEVSEADWIADWVMLAQRYAGDDTVIGADLHNEPHGAASWGSGDPATDWRLAAERAGDAILAANPRWLIVVEGVETNVAGASGSYWWGGNLSGVADYPVRLSVPGKVVYSPHDYGPGVYHQSWFDDPSFPDNLAGLWDQRWAYIHDQGIAPILVGEFGGRDTGTDTTEGVWQNALVDFIAGHDMYWTYWCWNPNSGDTGGILADDWTTVNADKQAMLQRLIDDDFGG